MATGDQADIVGRLQKLIPQGWFPNWLVPLRDGLLVGIANALAFVFSLLAYVRLQTRIATMTDGFLDMAAVDYFGGDLPRAAAQSDSSYRARIQSSLFLERATRPAMARLLTQLTGFAPIIIEPRRPADTGGYGIACGYGVAGNWGSMVTPFQAFIQVIRRPSAAGIGGTAPYGVVTSPIAGGYGVGAIQYASLSMNTDALTDADIYAAIESIKPEATTCWARIVPPTIPGLILETESGLLIMDEFGDELST